MTDLSRRRVIGAGAAVITAAVGLGAPIAGAPGARAADPTYTSAGSLYRRSRFTALRGTYFSLYRNGKGIVVRLVEVADLDGAPAGAPEQFRLTFRGRDAVPAQGTYSLRRKGFTSTSLFVVPDAADGSVTAIVNNR